MIYVSLLVQKESKLNDQSDLKLIYTYVIVVLLIRHRPAQTVDPRNMKFEGYIPFAT